MSVEDTLNMLGIEYEEASGEFRAACPQHKSRTGKEDANPSWYINAQMPGLHICLASETEVVTRDGVFPIGSLSGRTHTLLTSAGWVDAPVMSFGYQRLHTITLTRNGVLKSVRATAEHRWFVKGTGRKRLQRELRTHQLKPGMRLVSKTPTPVQGGKVSPWGAAHGIVYGDGTTAGEGRNRFCVVNLYGDKKSLVHYFPLSHHSSEFLQDGYSVDAVRVNGLPNSWKSLPPINESRSYLYGWLAGLFATDGCVTDNGTLLLSSSDRATLDFVRHVCTTRLNIATYPVRSQERVGKGESPSLIYTLPLVRSSLSPDFFLLSKHRERFEESQARGASDRIGWQVVSVEDSSSFEEVYCAVVQETGDFVLEDWILTGNCFSCGYKGNLATLVADLKGIDIGQAKAYLVEHRSDLDANSVRDRLTRATRWLTPRTGTFLPDSTLARFDIPPDWALRERRLVREAVSDFQVMWEDANGWWVLPIRDPYGGELMGWQIKSQVSKGFVRNRPPGVEKSSTLFGLNLLDRPDLTVWVVESPLDAVRLHGLGIHAVATYGSKFSLKQLGLLSAFERLVLAFDADDAGRAATDEFLYYSRPKGMDVLEVYYPDKCKDPGDCTDEQLLEISPRHTVRR